MAGSPRRAVGYPVGSLQPSGENVGILDNVERGLERAVNGAFARTFRSGLQPVELTSALRHELDTRAAIVSRDRTLAPNEFVLSLSEADLGRMRALGVSLTDDLVSFVETHARRQGYAFAGPVAIELAGDERLAEGVVSVASRTVRGRLELTPELEIAGRRHPLPIGSVVIGRGREADITLDDTGASRRHLEISWDGRTATARELGSTNGTRLGERRLEGSAQLAPDARLTVGRTAIVLRMRSRAVRDEPAPRQASPATRRLDDFWSAS